MHAAFAGNGRWLQDRHQHGGDDADGGGALRDRDLDHLLDVGALHLDDDVFTGAQASRVYLRDRRG